MKVGDKVLLKVQSSYAILPGSWEDDVKKMDNTIVTISGVTKNNWFRIHQIDFNIPPTWLHEIPQTQQGGIMSDTWKALTDTGFYILLPYQDVNRKVQEKFFRNGIFWNGGQKEYIENQYIHKDAKAYIKCERNRLSFGSDPTLPTHLPHIAYQSFLNESSSMSTSSKTYILDRALFEDDIRIELNTNS